MWPDFHGILVVVLRDSVTGIFTFWGENVLKFKSNVFSCTQNTPRTSREGNQMIFSNEEQAIISFFYQFFQETKAKLENISLMFQVAIHFHPSNP